MSSRVPVCPWVCSRVYSMAHTPRRPCHVALSFRTRGVMVARPLQSRRPALVPLSLCFSLQGVPASGGLAVAFLQSPSMLLSRLCGETPSSRTTSTSTTSSTGNWRDLLIASGGVGGWKLRSSPGSTDESSVGGEGEDDGSSSSFPGARGGSAVCLLYVLGLLDESYHPSDTAVDQVLRV